MGHFFMSAVTPARDAAVRARQVSFFLYISAVYKRMCFSSQRYVSRARNSFSVCARESLVSAAARRPVRADGASTGAKHAARTGVFGGAVWR